MPAQPVDQRGAVVARCPAIFGFQVLQDAEPVDPFVACADESLQRLVVLAQRLPGVVGIRLLAQKIVKRSFDGVDEQIGKSLGRAADSVKKRCRV